MATTITTINPPTVKSTFGWNWQDQQGIDPLAVQPIATLAADLETGAVQAPATPSAAPTYTVAGVNGIVGAGGSQGNGVKLAKLAAGRVLTVAGNGTSGATAKTGVATTGGSGTGLTVNLAATGGVVTGATVNTPGNGAYAIGDVVTVSTTNAGTGTAVTLRI